MGEPDYERFDEDSLCCAMDQMNGLCNAALLQLFSVLNVYEKKHSFETDGVRDAAEWLCSRYGLSLTSARRWAEAAAKLDHLPHTKEAFSCGRLSFDKLCLLLTVATEDNEEELLEHALRLNYAALRSLLQRMRPITTKEDRDAHEQRSLRWSFHAGQNIFRIWGRLRADQGAQVVKALERGADRIGPNPEGDWDSLPQRTADALVELCSAASAKDKDLDRATVVIHAELSSVVAREGVAETEEGIALSSEALRRSLCDCRLQIAAHDAGAEVVGTGKLSRSLSRSLLRQLRDRDKACVFPGCPRKRFLQAHHVEHWIRGGPSKLLNLCLLCSYHHHLMHEGGWNMSFDGSNPPSFLNPSGELFEPAPQPLCDELFERFFWDVEPETADTS